MLRTSRIVSGAALVVPALFVVLVEVEPRSMSSTEVELPELTSLLTGEHDRDGKVLEGGGAPRASKNKKKKTRQQILRKRLNYKPKKKVAKHLKQLVHEVFFAVLEHLAQYMPIVKGGGTTSTTLDSFCKSQWPNLFKGVFAADQHPTNEQMQRGMYIINTDRSDEPGQHWTAVCDGYFYDSFDRSSGTLFSNIRLPATGDDEEVRQRREESDCGQRCVAFLTCCREFGAETASRYL